jgi:cytochrome c
MSHDQFAATSFPKFRPGWRCRTAALSLAAVSLAAATMLCKPTAMAAQDDGPAPDSPQFYTRRVLPILQANCYPCHGGSAHRGGLSLATRDGMLKGGYDGAAIVPGDAQQSLLVKLIRHEGAPDAPMAMPPGSKIADADIATLTQWIQAGAVMPPDAPAE